MPVSGLVIDLRDDLREREAALEALEGDRRITVGPLQGACLPVVTETEGLAEQEALWHQIEALDGVLALRLAFHDFSDVPQAPTGG